MLDLILKSYFAFLLIPLITMAIEPTDPSALCDRFLGEQEKSECLARMAKEDFDWYAANTCSLQQDDKSFLGCLDKIKDATFNPQALELCAGPTAATDATRLSCIDTIKNKDYARSQLKKCSEAADAAATEACLHTNFQPRLPASTKGASGFQLLDIKK